MYRANGKPKDEPACNGRGTKDPKRYRIRNQVQFGTQWEDQPHSFSYENDALEYASMLSCYPLIYGMTQVIDTLDNRIVATFRAGEGLKRPRHKPGTPPYHVQLRYTVTPKGETWGWLSKQFHSHEQALAFAKTHLFPRKICDAVRIYKEDAHVQTYYSANVFDGHSLARAVADARAELARINSCPQPCPNDTDGDGDCPRCAPRRGPMDAMEWMAAAKGGGKTLMGFPVVEKKFDIPADAIRFARLPSFEQLLGKIHAQHLGKTRALFAGWFEGRFNTKCDLKDGLHAAMYEAFRAGLSLNVVRPHQS